MKTRFLLLLILFLTVKLGAQNREIDSLQRVESGLIDSKEKVDLLIKLSRLTNSKIKNYDTAAYYANHASQIAFRIGYSKGEGVASYALGQALYNKSQYLSSLKLFGKAEKILSALGDSLTLGSLSRSTSQAYRSLGRYGEALRYLDLSEKWLSGLQQDMEKGFTYLAYGILYDHQSNYAQALEYFYRAKDFFEKAGSRNNVISIYTNIGGIYSSQGNYAQALSCFEVVKKEYLTTNNQKGLSNVHSNIGNVYFKQQEYDKALKEYNTSLGISLGIKHRIGIASSYNNIAIVYSSTKKYQEAISEYEKALKIALEMNYPKGIIRTYSNISSNYYDLALYDSALVYSHKCLNLTRAVGIVADEKISLLNLYKIHSRLDQLDSAAYYSNELNRWILKYIRLNYFTLPDEEKPMYLSTLGSSVKRTVEFADLYGKRFPEKIDSALNFIGFIKGLSLKTSSAVRKSILKSNDRELLEKYDEWLSLRAQMSSQGETEMDQLKSSEVLSKLEKELAQASSVFNDLNSLHRVDWKIIQKSLKSNEAVIEFVNYNLSENDAEKYVAFVFNSKSVHPKVVPLCSGEELNAILGKTQGTGKLYVNGVYGTKEKSNDALYKKLWAPLMPYLKDVRTVYFSPEGLLHKISFAGITDDKGNFLSDRFDLVQVAGISAVTQRKKSVLDKRQNYLLMGGIDYNTDSTKSQIWSYLPGTLTETNHINSIASRSAGKVSYYTGKNATEEVFKSECPNAGVIHLSTHGYFFPDYEEISKEVKFNEIQKSEVSFRGNSNYADFTFVKNKNVLYRSGIILAGANSVWERSALEKGDDGILTSMEVSNLDLSDSRLVVLSACETGLGDIYGSEGVFGLQRSFMIAGVENLIMSLWQVPDQETAEFMSLFYTSLLKSEDIRKAFRTAQNEMKKKYDPYYWAAFVLL